MRFIIALYSLFLIAGCVDKTNEWHVTNSDIYVEGTGVEVNKGDDKLSSEPDVSPTINTSLYCNRCHELENIIIAMGSRPLTKDDLDIIFGEPEPPAPTKPDPPVLIPPEETPPPEPTPELSRHFHHYNPDSAMGGPALILCPDSPRFNTCDINGITMRLHGSQDKGRDLWTIYNNHRGIGGVITCTTGNAVVKYHVNGGSGMHWGDCR